MLSIVPLEAISPASIRLVGNIGTVVGPGCDVALAVRLRKHIAIRVIGVAYRFAQWIVQQVSLNFMAAVFDISWLALIVL